MDEDWCTNAYGTGEEKEMNTRETLDKIINTLEDGMDVRQQVTDLQIIAYALAVMARRQV